MYLNSRYARVKPMLRKVIICERFLARGKSRVDPLLIGRFAELFTSKIKKRQAKIACLFESSVKVADQERFLLLIRA